MENEIKIGWGVGHAPGNRTWGRAPKIGCLNQQTGSCLGCPVLARVYEAARHASINRPSKVNVEMGQAAREAEKQCPPGLKPDTKLIRINDYGRSLEGRLVVVYLVKDGKP